MRARISRHRRVRPATDQGLLPSSHRIPAIVKRSAVRGTRSRFRSGNWTHDLLGNLDCALVVGDRLQYRTDCHRNGRTNAPPPGMTKETQLVIRTSIGVLLMALNGLTIYGAHCLKTLRTP